LEARWQRHHEVSEFFWQSLKNIGLECHVAPEHRLPSLTTVRIPDGVDGKTVQKHLLNEFNIEIAGGLGELAGKVWRVGLMGYNSRRENGILLLEALQTAIGD